MTRLRTWQTNFTAGELSPRLAGRGDLRAYANGAAALRNVTLHPTGGVSRRDGLRYMDGLPGPARLIAFEFNTEQTYLVAVVDGAVRIYHGDAVTADLSGPWTAAHLPHLAWTQSADTLLICHPDVAPRALTRQGAEEWRLDPWPIHVEETGLARWPFYRFAAAEVTLAAEGEEGTVTLTASAPVFVPGHGDVQLRRRGRTYRVLAVLSATQVLALALEPPEPEPEADSEPESVSEPESGAEGAAETPEPTEDDTGAPAPPEDDPLAPTRDWDEAAWSPVRGWPVCATFHQDRLVVGGSRDLPNRLWLSRSADLFNFDVGQGLEDEAIAFPILSDQVNAIRAVFSGRHLQVFTSGAEWMVTGEPLTPDSVHLRRQTRIGSPTDRSVPPRDVDGATLFVSRSGREVREFLYTDLEQGYQALDLSILADALVRDPVDQDYDPGRRLLFLVLADGRVAALTAYRSEQVIAWTGLETHGAVRAVAVSGGQTVLAVERARGWTLERLDPDLALDCALSGEAEAPTALWSGLEHLDGQEVRVEADGVDRGLLPVIGGSLTLPVPARRVSAGLPFAHVIEPMPPAIGGDGGGGGLGLPLRPVLTTFRLAGTPALVLDLGHGPQPVPLRRLGSGFTFDQAPRPFTGDRRLRHLGWSRAGSAPAWRIRQDTPLPFTLLSVATEWKVSP